MVIISDCLRNNVDEGAIKLASTLSKKLKQIGAKIVAVNSECDFADVEVKANKTFSNKSLYDSIGDTTDGILYIPFASNTLGSAIRVFSLSRRTKSKVSVLFTISWEMGALTKLLLKASGCQIITISQDSNTYFKRAFPNLQIINIKTGVDCSRFCKVDAQKKKELRQKYKLPLDKTILLHVGHLKYGRNVDTFLNVDEKYYVVLVFSSVTEKERSLMKALESKDNIRIICDYVPNVEEIYQASDIYVFPVVEENNSIDIPLSVLEAASCNLSIVSTAYKEISFWDKRDGLYIVNDFNKELINQYVEAAMQFENIETDSIAKAYDWKNAVENLQSVINDLDNGINKR